MFCEHCGAKLADGVLFCEDCGMRVESAPPAQPESFQAAAPPPQPMPPADKKGKRGMVVGLAAGGALLLGMMVFFGIRLLGKEASSGDASEPSAMEEAAKPGEAGDSAAFDSLPAHTIETPGTLPQVTPAQAEPAATPGAAPAANAAAGTAGDGLGALTELEATLPGIWLSEPDEYGDRSLVFIGLREFGSALAMPQTEANVGPEEFPEMFQVRGFTWSGYRVEGDTFYTVDDDGFETAYTAKLISRDEIELSCEDEFLSFLHPRLHRVEEASFPPLPWFVQGCWVSEKKDEEGKHIAIQFSMEGDNTCDVWITRTTDSPPKFGEWSKGSWRHESRIPAEFEIVADFLHIDLANGATLDFSLEVKDAWTMKLWVDSYNDTFRRMDWLPEW